MHKDKTIYISYTFRYAVYPYMHKDKTIYISLLNILFNGNA